MKLVCSCVLFLLSAGFGFSAEPVIEFRGVMAGGGPTKLSLVDKSSGTTRWVEVGQVFLGYTVKAYDPAIETATLTRMGRDYRIRINSSKIEDAPVAPGGTGASAAGPKIPFETARAIFNQLRQISAATDQYMLETGKNFVTLDDLVGPTKYIKELKPEAGEDYRVLKLRPGGARVFTVTTASGETVTYDPIGNSSSFCFIRPGDTFATIARRLEIPVAQLAALNQVTDPAKLQVGQMLRTK